MKIAYEGFNVLLTLEEGEAYKICIEDVFSYRSLIEKLLDDINDGAENILLTDKDKLLKTGKVCELIINPFCVEINQKKILLKLYSELQSVTVNEIMFKKTLELKRYINDYLLDLELNSDYSLQHNMDFEIKDLFSAVKLKIDDDSIGIVEQIAQYIRNAHVFLGIRLFWFVGLNTFLKKEEVRALLKEARYNKINIIMLENQTTANIEDEKLFIMDKDQCIIHCDY